MGPEGRGPKFNQVNADCILLGDFDWVMEVVVFLKVQLSKLWFPCLLSTYLLFLLFYLSLTGQKFLPAQVSGI